VLLDPPGGDDSRTTRESRARINVALVGNFLSASATTRTVGEELGARLTAAGHAVLMTSRAPRRVIRLLDMLATIVRRRRRYTVALIDVYSGAAFVYAEAVATLLRMLGKPYVLTLHGGRLPEFSRRWPGRTRRVLRGAAAVTAPSRYLLEQMKPYRDDILLLPNAVEVSAYPFHVRTAPRPRLVWLRAFHGMYNPSLAVAALARVAEQLPDVRLAMIGPDKGDGSLAATRRVAVAHHVEGQIVFAGGVPKRDVPRWLESADVFLNTTDVDNAPVSLVEAMAAGLCIVSTNVGGIPYLLEHERDALLVPPGNAGAMADAIQRLFDEPGLAARLSRNARLKAEQLDWSVVLPKWVELLAGLTRRNGDS
jgi:L-malate glycosyltransferase